MTPGPRTPPPISDTDPYRVTLTTTTGGGLADPARPQTALSAGELARTILRRGGGRDVQVLVPDGAQHAALLQALADRLGRDVLMVPAGATTTGADTATPVDRTTGAVVDWLLVQPPSLATSLPGWYDLDGGRIRHRRGWAALPLARGLAFTTREAFPLARAAAASVGVGHPAMATVAFSVDDAAPLLCGYDGVRVAASGTDLAAALSAVALYGGDLRVWPQVPTPPPSQADTDGNGDGDPEGADPRTGRLLGIRVDPADRLRHVGLGAEVTDGLAVHLTELAARVGATVWAPPTGSRVVLLEGVRDLAVRDRDGRLRSWQAYRPPGPDRPDRFWSDRDGRLVPVGGTMDAAVGPTGEDQPGPTASGVELVSVATDARPAALRRWATVRRRDGLFRMELAVLDDGRLAARHGDGGLLAVGPREFRALLRRAGWTGQDLALLTPVPPERFAQLRAHVTALADQIPADIWAPEPGARLAVVEGQPRSLRAAGAPARWCRLAPAAPGATDLVTVSARWRSHDGWLVPTPPTPAADGASGGRVTAGTSADPALDDPAPDAQASADPTPVDPPPPGRRPPMVSAARGSRAHGVNWLPERPDVNAETFDLYVPVALPAARVAADGLPTAELFVVGQLDADRLRMAHFGASVLRVSVAPGGAVATTGFTDTAPPDLRHLLRGVDSYLLPAGWLDRVQVAQGWTPAGPGEWQAQPDAPPAALLLRCTGARHGVDGLPNDVVRWPAGRRAATGYAVLPTVGGPDDDHLAVTGSRPAAPAGAARLVQLRIEPGQAIDVAASAGRIAPLTAVRSRLVTLNAAGVEVLVPPRSYDRVTVTRVYGAEDGRWVLRARRVELPLATLFTQTG
ncbi:MULTISPECIES: hypothetical protein [unclassified Solwaraspora]|uniref:hypothetical protein n=1 Tax=unclassified Solwaraspora TaxID=2627926 RepID=UPI00259B8414|nr:hypothetical protein [Solwaraspora sp. WMMA2056]WJK38789.1 hypothetical protein O7608_20070 [Solwaraspora sp. WMMA2056]